MKRLMDQTSPHSIASQSAQPDGAPAVSPNGAQPLAAQNGSQSKEPPKPARLILLVRHGQTTFNVEGRLPGQLPGVALTDEGRSQAQRAAVALSGLPLSTVISSPLERACETAEIIGRGWALPVRLDERLMDTDVAYWAGRKIEEVNRTDPRWKAFVAHPTEPPEGVEGLGAVQQRSVAAVEDILRDPTLGNYIVLVAHADVVKLIVAHYSHMSIDTIHHVAIGNASISVLAFGEEAAPHLLAVNWTALPFWLFPPSQPAPALEPQQVATPSQRPAGTEETMIQAPGGVEISERSLEEPVQEPRQSAQEEHPEQENVSPT
ncbi:MAG: histidine phosphatase family protein [Ktedonobacterales bacterium]